MSVKKPWPSATAGVDLHVKFGDGFDVGAVPDEDDEHATAARPIKMQGPSKDANRCMALF